MALRWEKVIISKPTNYIWEVDKKFWEWSVSTDKMSDKEDIQNWVGKISPWDPFDRLQSIKLGLEHH